MNSTLLTKNDYIEKDLVGYTKVGFSLSLAQTQCGPSFISVAIIIYSSQKRNKSPKGKGVYFGL